MKKIESLGRFMCTTEAEYDRTFEKIKQLLREYFKPKYVNITESHQLYNAKPEEDESVSNLFIQRKHVNLIYF